MLQANIPTEKPLPPVPDEALKAAAAGQPTLIPPGTTNLVGAVIKLDNIPDTFLYTIRTVDPEVMRSMRMMEDNTAEYRALEAGRTSLQIAFGVLYLGFALIVLLAAIWTAIAVADRIVRPIRLLIGAADAVGSGNLDVHVPVRAADGDVGNLSRTFNKMIAEIRAQQAQILDAKDEVDHRRRFIEAVLSGVTAAVIGVEGDGRMTIANLSAEIVNVQPLPSGQLVLMQLCDILLGAASSRLNFEAPASPAKLAIVERIEARLGRKIGPTWKSEEKFNVFKINLKGGW